MASNEALVDDHRVPKRWYRRYPELGPPGIMPVAPLISAEQYALERERLWPRTWLMVGRTEEIPHPGDYLRKDIPPVQASLIVARGRDNVIRTFHNVCPHRGSQICWEKSGQVSSAASFKCPYHGFTFDLEGKLQWVPDQENFYDLKKEKLGLTEIPTDTWNGFIFIHLHPQPQEPLRKYLGEIVDRLEDYPFHEQSHFYEYRVEFRCSWKVAMSNFVETFHHALHADVKGRASSDDNPFSRNNLVKLYDKHRLISVFRNPKMKRNRIGTIAAGRYGKSRGNAGAAPAGGPDLMNINKTFFIHNIFPNFQLNVNNGSWFRHQFWPTGRDTVIWETRKYFPKPIDAGERFFHEYNNVTGRERFMEDVNCLERLQNSLESGLVENWILQDEEIAVQHFNKVAADYTRA